MKTAFETGMNRTGIALSPIDSPLAIEGAKKDVVPEPGDSSALDAVRLDYMREAAPMGSIPPPATVKGMAKTALTALKGERAPVLIDKLAERLAFERGGVRLYQLLSAKADFYPSWTGGPDRAALLEIERDELEHFALVRDCLTQLGADTTAMTPSADVTTVLALGLRQVLSDPRADLRQGLEAVLVAELTDNAGWELLIRLTREMGQNDMAAKFEGALRAEERHLALVKGWLSAGVLGAANA